MVKKDLMRHEKRLNTRDGSDLTADLSVGPPQTNLTVVDIIVRMNHGELREGVRLGELGLRRANR